MLRKALLAIVLALSLVGGATAAAEESRFKPWGTTDGKNAVLKFGCHNYKYIYKVTPPTKEWTAEIFLDDPTGETLASAAFDNYVDPKRGKAFWRICKPSTEPGRFKIRMKVTAYTSSQDYRAAWTKPTFFRLRRG